MAESLSFDDKISGLAEYWDKIEELNPDNSNTPNPPFYSGGHSVARGLREVRNSLVFDVGSHARVEYGNRGFSSTNLRLASGDEMTERAGILAMMTVPPSPEDFYERATQIQELLGKIVAGDEIHVAEHSFDGWRWNEQTVSVDPSREIYTVFNGHISGRDMRIQYDRADSYGLEGKVEYALVVGLPAMFFREDVITYPTSLEV